MLEHASALPRIVAVTHPQNLPSQRVTARLGMRNEGLTDRYYNLAMRLFVVER
nr:GNAT family N-acetyltransferase [Calidifontibacter indicus]